MRRSRTRAGVGRTTASARRFTARPPCGRRGGELTMKKENPEEQVGMGRREFLTATAVAGGGMVLGFWLPPRKAEATGVTLETAVRPEPWYREAVVPEINAW